MNIMKSLLAEFSPKVAVEPAAVVVPSACTRCHGANLWQTYGNSQWYCQACDPPPTESMVANRTGAPTIRMSVAYAVGRHAIATASVCGNRIQFKSFRTEPVCRCGSHMVIENTWSDGLVTFECASCAAGIAADTVQGKS